jgi:HK97 family phage major capsid protein
MKLKEKLLKLIADKEARKKEIGKAIDKSEDAAEVRKMMVEITAINDEVDELRAAVTEIEAQEALEAKGKDPEKKGKDLEDDEPESRGAPQVPQGAFKPLGTYRMENQNPNALESREAEALEAAEKRGNDIKEGRSVTIATTGIITPTHQSSDIRSTFNEVSSLIDGVAHKPLPGGESFKQPYIAGYGTGDYTNEGENYAEAEPTFGYAEINKTKVTAYAEDTEELNKLTAADYDGEVQKGVRIASRKKITREILIGTGATGRLVGIFSSNATAIDADTDITIAEIDEMTLDEIMFSYGGDEDVEDAAVLILNKADLKAFAQLRTADGKKIHTIVSKGNYGTIDGVPYIINSACKAISSDATTAGQYAMAYGPLSNYLLAIFSEMEVARSTDYKFKQGMIAHRSSVFVGGNVISKNGFLRVKKG